MHGHEIKDVVSTKVAILKKLAAFESRMPLNNDGDNQLEESKIIWPK